MTEAEKKVWGIHTQNENLFLKKDERDMGRIAIKCPEMGDLSKIEDDRNAFKERYMQVCPNAKKGAIPIVSGMLYRFCYEIRIGDYIVFPSKSDRMVYIGEVMGNYEYDDSQDEYVQIRSVKWLKHFPRTKFSQGALHEIGSAITFFLVKNYADEFLSALEPNFNHDVDTSGDDETVRAVADDIIENTKDFVLKELSRNLKGYPLEGLVANLLKAMGYRVTISQPGGDNGIDITAYKDELPPRIVVQVKSQDDDIKETLIHSLKGAMSEGDYGVFVTLSNYKKNAMNYLKKTPIIRGINGTELVDLILKYYDHLDEKYQKMIPLKKVYIPVPWIEENAK